MEYDLTAYVDNLNLLKPGLYFTDITMAFILNLIYFKSSVY